MTSSIPDVSVIICAYTEKRWSDLVAAVESVRVQTVPAREIVVVVDHNPVLFERVREHLKDILVLENNEDQGLSGARNSGISVASGGILAFLDDDGVAAIDWIEHIVAAYSDLQVVGVGGSIEPLWLSHRPMWLPQEFDWVVGCTYKGMPEKPAAVRNLIGCNMSFRREVFDAVGGFNNGIGRVGTRPVGCEETELCIRIRQRWPGRIVLYDPKIKVQHCVPANRACWRYFRSRCYSEGLSKALVAQEAGARDALSTERAYTTRTIPLGVARRIVHAMTLREPRTGFSQVACIVAGVAITGLGYVQGTLALQLANLGKRQERLLTWRS